MLTRRTALLLAPVLAACLPPGIALAQTAPPAASAARFASDRIAVTVRGEGPDVVLIPGLSSSPKVWAETVAAQPGRRFHLVHVNGFAGAPAGANADGGPVAAPVAEEIARYIAAAGLKKPTVIGHSMGGTIGMMVASRHPERVGKLMVVDMLPWMGAMFGAPGATVDSVRPVADQIRAGMSAPPSPQGDAYLVQTINGMIKTQGRRAEALADSRASDTRVSAAAFHELIVTDLRPELPKITAPTTVLYVRPDSSPLSEVQMEAAYRASFAGLKGAELKRIPDAWHFIMYDQPERFQAEVRDFLG